MTIGIEALLRRIGKIDTEIEVIHEQMKAAENKFYERLEAKENERCHLIQQARDVLDELSPPRNNNVARVIRVTRFTEAQIKEMCEMSKTMTQIKIGEHFGVSQATISTALRQAR